MVTRRVFSLVSAVRGDFFQVIDVPSASDVPPSARSHVTCVSNQRMTHNNEFKTVTKSDTHCLLMTASGTVETRVEATVYIKDSDTHFRVQLVDDHPVVLSLGVVCEAMISNEGRNHI